MQLAHVRDVERPGAGPDRKVLGDHALVLDGHLPAGERHQPRTGRDVTLEERRPAQGRVHGRDNSVPAVDGLQPRPNRRARVGRGSSHARGSVLQEARDVDLGVVAAGPRLESRHGLTPTSWS